MLLPAGIVTVSEIAPLPVAVNPVAPPAATAVQFDVVIPLGSGSDTVAPVTALGPALETTTVYVTLPPGVYVADPSVFVTDRSALLACVSVSVAELFPGVGSVTPPGGVTVAVFANAPVCPAGTAMVTVYVMLLPAGI